MQWDCPVFGAVVYFNRPIPERWPSGVLWDQGDKNLRFWKYDDNPLKYSEKFTVDEGIALVRMYNLSECLCITSDNEVYPVDSVETRISYERTSQPNLPVGEYPTLRTELNLASGNEGEKAWMNAVFAIMTQHFS